MTWYPIIDFEKCVGCCACIMKCTHGVYEPIFTDKPNVINPEGCVEGCKGCARICHHDAIRYFGDKEG